MLHVTFVLVPFLPLALDQPIDGSLELEDHGWKGTLRPDILPRLIRLLVQNVTNAARSLRVNCRDKGGGASYLGLG